jgi:hypothetical protein
MTANSQGRGLVAIGRRRTYPHPREGVAWPRHHRQCGGAGSHRHSGVLYGALIGAGNDPLRLFIGYLIGGGVMIIGGVTELLPGVPAQQETLEAVARPLSVVAPLHKAAYSPSMQPSGTGASAAA